MTTDRDNLLCLERSENVLTKKWQEVGHFVILLLIAVGLLITRIGRYDYFPGKYLWAEDGQIFINQASSLGVSAIGYPYAGYLHVYPRLFAFIANYFELIHRPIILFVGWFIAYIFMFVVLLQRAKQLGMGFIASLFLVTLVCLQPNYGENFFNITNAQWLLGVAFSVLALTSTSQSFRFSIENLVLLSVLGLTGPFSIILLPVLMLKAIVLKDFKNSWVYWVILGCVAIQSIVLINSGRAAPVGINTSFEDWYTAFFRIALFGAKSSGIKYVGLFFWGLLGIVICEKYLSKEYKKHAKKSLPVLFLLTAALFVIASLYSMKNYPLGRVSIGGGNRYSWLPYVLVFFAAMVASNHRRILQTVLFGLILFICYVNFHMLELPNLQFSSFAKFAEYQKVNIPIHPQWAKYPSWSIEGEPSGSQAVAQLNKIDVDLNSFTADYAKLNLSASELQRDSGSNVSILESNSRFICENSTDVGLEIEINRSSEGWMQVFFNNTPHFSEVKSLRRWYPSGLVTAQFAFPNESGGFYIRFALSELPGTDKVEKITLYCLP